MKKISHVVACLTLALVLAQSTPAVAQSRLPLGAIPSIPPGELPSIPQLTPQFNTPGPQIVPASPPAELSPLPTDPPSGSLGLR